MRLLVFSGPTIDASRVTLLRPGAEVMPPIKRGDLVRAEPRAGDVVVIIDGYFFYKAAIQHMEIIDAMRDGVRVIGASSIGALRAAELAPLGMIGVGDIFTQFASDALRADDEVAVLHDPETFECYSEALVNLRHNLARAVARGVISSEVSARVVDRLAATWFGDRTRHFVWKLLREEGAPEDEQRLRALWADEFEDIKRRDAEAALRACLEDPPRAQAALPGETYFCRFLKREYRMLCPKFGISETDVLRYCQVAEEEGPAIYRRAALLKVLSVTDEEQGGRAFAGGVSAAERYVAAEQRACALQQSGRSLEEVCLDLLVRGGHVTRDAPRSTIDAIVQPLLIWPGEHADDFLRVELQRRGIFQRATDELLGFVRRRLSRRLDAATIRHGRSRREYIIDLYASAWHVASTDVLAEAQRRGFMDLNELCGAAGKVSITSLVAAAVRSRATGA